MDQWEHRTILIRRTGGTWSIEFADGQSIEGIDQVLDEYGAKGWELVSFLPQAWATGAGQFGPYEFEAYRAVFKRRAAAVISAAAEGEANP